MDSGLLFPALARRRSSPQLAAARRSSPQLATARLSIARFAARVYYVRAACSAETRLRLGFWSVGAFVGWLGGGQKNCCFTSVLSQFYLSFISVLSQFYLKLRRCYFRALRS